MSVSDLIQQGDALRAQKDYAGAIAAYEQAAACTEIPDADLALKLARCCEKISDYAQARQWILRVTDSCESFTEWQAAAQLLDRVAVQHQPESRRTARLAVLGSYTTAQLVPLLKLAALRQGVHLETYEADYAQYRQEILNPASDLYAFNSDFVLLALHADELALPAFSDDPDSVVDAEVARWTSLWKTLKERSSARIVMHNFALPLESSMGHLGTRLAGARMTMMQQVNRELGLRAGNDISIVDCDRLAALIGRRNWFDDRFWHVSKQAVSLSALPLLAKHTAAVIAADLGLTRKCLVLDLDNTLWGGVIGEDGLNGIRLGAGADGEAYVAFQEYVLGLRERGVILAVCSKNNDADAREPFEKHPDMRIKLDDIAIFVANWKPKSENLQEIARTLNIGLDALVFVDDNPAEREIVRQQLPEVEVIPLPEDPAGYRRALAECMWFEPATFTQDDAKKTEQYRARAEISRLESECGSLESFYASLQMEAEIAPFDEMHLPRIVQLIGKSNQFNLTTRRHTLAQVERFCADPDCVTLYLKLTDRFADHGLVSVLIAQRKGDVLEIDTWLMSCRVISRTVENAMLNRLCAEAERLACSKLRGIYIPTAKNAMVKDIYAKLGFKEAASVPTADPEATVWHYDLTAAGNILNQFIAVRSMEKPSINLKECASDAA